MMFMDEERSSANQNGQLPTIPSEELDQAGAHGRQAAMNMDYDASYGRQIDPHTEQKIINHLKDSPEGEPTRFLMSLRKLNRRVEKRLADIYEKDEKSKARQRQHDEGSTPMSRRSSKVAVIHTEQRPPQVETHRDIFQRYNEYGERVAFTPATKRRPGRGGVVKPQLKPLLSNDDLSRGAIGGGKEPLPSIQKSSLPIVVTTSEDELNSAHVDLNGAVTDANDADVEDNDVITEEPEEEVDETAGAINGRESAGILINTSSRDGEREKIKNNLTFQLEVEAEPSDEEPELKQLEEQADIDVAGTLEVEAPISPVPTPHIILRPMTREMTRLSLQDKHSRILRGNLNIRCPRDTKVARLYVSNTGIDTKWELRYLMTELYPQMKEYCLQHDCEMQIYDMHWSMDDMPFDNHSYVDNCVHGVQECLQTRAINFVTLTSGKYGPNILPATIDAEEYEAMFDELIRDHDQLTSHIEALQQEQKDIDDEKEKNEHTDEEKSNKRKKAQAKRQQSIQLAQSIMAKERDIELIKPEIVTDWYKKDTNVIPAVYRLQRISTKFPDINKADPKKKAPAIRSWDAVSQRILGILQRYSKRVLQESGEWKKYFTSLLEKEIDGGMKHNQFSPGRICWFSKNFDGINPLDEAASEFLETEETQKLRMVELNDTLKNFHELPKRNREAFGLDWIKEGFAPEHLRNHMLYLEKLSDRINTLVKESLVEMFEDERATIPSQPHEKELYMEVIQHVEFCQQRARNFHGRKELLQKVKSYLRSDSNLPLTVYGKSGMGRKSLVCRAAEDCQNWCKITNPAVVFRSCGITSESQNIRLLLHSLNMQLAIIYDNDPSMVPTGYRGLVNDFSDKIKNATEDRPLIIILDSLDRLSGRTFDPWVLKPDGDEDEHDARKLSWMPKELPPYVKVIFSCQPDDRFQVLEACKKLWSKEEDNFIEIGKLPSEDGAVILSHWLSSANRTLTDDQYSSIMKVYAECSNPLFLRCAFHEAISWTSYIPPENYKLAAAVKRVATVAFARLERDHGEPLVRRALGYITASRKGVTMNELEDLISLDDLVMEELTLQYKLDIRRCPPGLLVRLKQDLREYITELAADGLKTIQWSHVQFQEAAAERYLLQRDKAPSYHKAMAEYFTGTWAGVKKPTPADEDGVLRYVASQKLSFQVEVGKDGSTKTVYNKRALNELPYHFINSNQFDMLKSECLCNYEWLLAKLCGCGIRNIFDDFYLAISIEPKDKDLTILLETFQLSRAVLEKDPRQLGSQLSGRIRSLIMKDVPVTAADPKVYPACHPLMAQISKSSIPTFYPSTSCLTPPGGALADILVGHKAEITAIAFTSEGMRAISTSLDNTMKMWDLRTGKVTKTINDVGKDVLQVMIARDNQVIVTSETSCVRVWSLETEKCLLMFDDFDDYAKIAISQNSQILICYLVGVNMLRSYNLADCTLLKESQLERGGEEVVSSIDKDKTLIISSSTVGDQLLIAYRDSSEAFSQNIKTGAIVYTLTCANESARVTALAVCGEYFAVGYQFKYLKREMPYAVDIFATAGGAYVRTLRGCDEDNITDLYINNTGSHVLCASTSEHTWSSDLAVWNMETEEHKHLASHAGVAHVCGLNTLQYVLTSLKGDTSLKLWNLSGSIIKPAPKMKQSVGVLNLVSMKDYPRYVVASSTDNGPLTVWNVAKGKTSGSAVRIEHGLVDPTDIVVVRNTKAVILSDRGITGSSSIYQSMYIYDLRTKRYERKVPGVYIIPSQAHEFKLLNDELLMGLSENRNQIYIWNLNTGTIAYRLKPSFQSKLDHLSNLNQEALLHMKKRQYTAKMTAWDRRTESHEQKQKRHELQMEDELREMEEKRKERENGVEQFLISGNEKVVVASFFSHHLCVFDMERKDHIQTLENDNSLLHLYVAALTHDGSYLVHTNYDEDEKVSYVTLWDCFDGTVKKRLRNEKDVCAIGISDDAQRILFGKGNCELRIWEPFKHKSLRKITGYSGMSFQFGMNKIFILTGGRRGIIYAGDISMWDLDKGTVLAVYTPDTRISAMTVAMQGQLLCFGLKDSLSVVSLRLIDNRIDGIEDEWENIMGEQYSDSSDEE